MYLSKLLHVTTYITTSSQNGKEATRSKLLSYINTSILSSFYLSFNEIDDMLIKNEMYIANVVARYFHLIKSFVSTTKVDIPVKT